MGLRISVLAASAAVFQGACPFAGQGHMPHGHPSLIGKPHTGAALKEYGEAVKNLDFHAVKADIKALLTDSQDWWPSDDGNYGPLFLRLAWHCAGTYRTSDGRGGCEGGLMRFEPERSWADNTNLDKARRLLVPIKMKYGIALSWGDLFILAGTTAIEAMGGPVLGFCGGRVDAYDGQESAPLGPSAIQEKLYPCPVNGMCEAPLGTTTIGAIYLNPEGPMGVPDPAATYPTIADSFGRMGFNCSETVALIGGGHNFGKAHGPCPAGAGPPPIEDPVNPWPGLCGTGKGEDTFTSGFELYWTHSPTKWSNAFFKHLIHHEWKKYQGPGGRWQWRAKKKEHARHHDRHHESTGWTLKNEDQNEDQGGDRNEDQNEDQNADQNEHHAGHHRTLGMLTSDVALLHDPEAKQLVEMFANDRESLDNAFAHVWYKLTTLDMGPVERCVGPDVPPAQPFQYPLPPAPAQLPDFGAVAAAIKQVFRSEGLPADGSYYGPVFVRLAWQCASTFRNTDHFGGCNGARLRFAPEKNWPSNANLDNALLLLQPIKESFGDILTWADLIVLAGGVAIEEGGGPRIKFCGGRSDALDGQGSKFLSEPLSAETTDSDVMRDWMRIKGFSERELVALIGGGHSLGQRHPSVSGYWGAWTADPTTFSNDYFRALFTEQWELVSHPATNKEQYKANGKELYMLKSDLILMTDPDLAAIAQDYAADVDLFARDFAAAWTKLMNADRFDGPTGNVCDCSEEVREDVMVL